MSFTSTDPCSHNSENTWFTPKNIIPRIEFDLDPCTMSFRPFDIASKNFEYDKGVCGLRNDWFGNVWLNPPYGKEINPFIDKFIKHKNGICLVFCRMGTDFMQRVLKEKAVIFFLRKRIRFIDRNLKTSSNAGTDSCFIIYGDKNIQAVKNSTLEGVFINE